MDRNAGIVQEMNRRLSKAAEGSRAGAWGICGKTAKEVG